MEQFEAMRHIREKSCERFDYTEVWSRAIGSFTSVSNTTTRRVMDSMSVYHRTRWGKSFIHVSNFASDKSFDRQLMRVVYHWGGFQVQVSTSLMWGAWSYIGMIEANGELDCSKTHIHLRELDKSEDKSKRTNIPSKDAKENKIDTSSTTWWRRPYVRVVYVVPSTRGDCLEKTETLKQVVERGEEVMTSPEGLNYSKPSVS